jgi:hypothetical protein
MDTPEEEKSLAVRASETIAGDLLSALVQEFRLLPDIWAKLGKDEQHEIIDRIRKRVSENVREAVRLIASGERMTIAAELRKVTFADKAEAVFAISKRDPAAMELCHVQGLTCLIVMADAQQHMGGIDAEHKDIRQGDMFDGQASDANSLIEQVRRRTQTPKHPPAEGDANGSAAP